MKNAKIIFVVIIVLLVSTCGNLMNNLLFEVTAGRYLFKYDANGASSGTVPVDDGVYQEGDEVVVSENSGSLALDGSFFIGWNTESDGSGTRYQEGETYEVGGSDITLYALWGNPVKLLAEDGESSDRFGCAAAVSGDYLIIGSYQSGSFSDEKGAAYIFHQTETNTWDTGFKLEASDGADGDEFGYAVAISGDYAIVGARYNTVSASSSGAAYIYRRTGINTWGEETLLDDSAGGDYFGWSVAIDGGYAVVGAPGDDGITSNCGTSHIYQRNGTNDWALIDTLYSTWGAPAGADHFGAAVAIDGDYIAAGAFGNDENGYAVAGAAFLYDKTDSDSWSSEFHLFSSNGEAGAEFGRFLSMSGGYVIIGARYEDSIALNSGAAYIYHRTGIGAWGEETKLMNVDGEESDFFGCSVSIFGDYAVVGEANDDSDFDNSGSAYLYKRSGGNDWQMIKRIVASNGSLNDYFGSSVAISEKYIVAGAPSVDGIAGGAGSAWVVQYR